MRRYIVRNLKETKRTNSRNDDRSIENIARRDYSLTNKKIANGSSAGSTSLDDLKAICSAEPLIPFTGPDTLFYLQLREVVQEVLKQRQNKGERGVFVSMDLQQGLSSYPQLFSTLG